MAMTLASGKTFSDSAGNDYTTPYLHVDSVVLQRTAGKAQVLVHIYKDQAAKDGGKAPVLSLPYEIANTDYDTYFGNTIVTTSGKDIYALAYEFLKDVDKYDLDENGNQVVIGKAFADWIDN